MCGIAGVVASNPIRFTENLKKMMVHRGPDYTALSELKSHSRSIQILHHRLSIIDLSDAANQPFYDESKQYALIFNGEIYNYKELKINLENLGVNFKTSSDTEVLLQHLMRFGESGLNDLNGMFAFAFFDLMKDEMLISRDPFGEKPFYYVIQDDKFIFSSEIKFVLEASGRKFNINGKVLGEFYSSHFLETKETETFFSGILKLPAGSFAKVRLQDKLVITPIKYYSPNINPEILSDPREAIEKIHKAISHSVDIRLRSDVPVGLFLSGGIDSSILAALSTSKKEDITFLSIVSGDSRFDESTFIDIVAKHLKKESIKINIQNDAAEFWELLPKMIWHNDEPVISFTSVAYYKMIQAARDRGLKVLLTGQGADEVFLGYKKFKFWHYKNLLKSGRIDKLIPAGFSELLNSDLFESFSISEAMRYAPGGVSKTKTRAWGSKLAPFKSKSARDSSNLRKIQYDDIVHYSVPVLLHYEDRLSMAHGAEVRVPFLDKSIVNIGMALSSDLKIKNGFSKYILRKAYEDVLPKEIIWRRDKKGFTIPQEMWMKNELSRPIEELFTSNMISYDMGILDRKLNLEDYKSFKSGNTKVLGFKDIFTRISVEKWMKVYSPYLNQEID